MPLPAGTRLGPYELLSLIGAGAMGEVYRARDTRLNRDVAVKVLPPAFARDPDRLSRFEREARAVAAINHPNILAVHDIGSADLPGPDQTPSRATYMITELLDGDTLRARLDQGPLPLRKSVDVAMQIARGLAAAHERGIVHRDLKPENIVLTRDGHVKILDFGLAKPSTNDDHTIAGTEPGVVMGTVGYMAPEQVRGESADPRADLFALGAVLYELADGRRAFSGPTPAETMTAILREDPPDMRTGIPPGLDRIARHAMEKDPADRFQSARDFAFALQALSETSSAAPVPAGTFPQVRAVKVARGREIAAWAIAAIAIVAAVLLWIGPATPPSGASSIVVPVVLPGTGSAFIAPSVSPDGQQIAFLARNAGHQIWVRKLDAMRPQPLKGTEGARVGSLCWSPDGKFLGFMAGSKLKVIELATERVEQIADASSGYGAAWGADGTILFSPDERGPIYRVSAKGGAATPVTTLDQGRKDQAHRWPQFMPDGKHFIFMPWNSSETLRAIQLAAFDGSPTSTLLQTSSGVVVAGSHLIYVEDRAARLMAQAFDPNTLRVKGAPVPVVDDDNVSYFWSGGYVEAAVGAGTLVYTTGKYQVSQLTWFSRTGRPLSTLGGPDAYYDPALSPDGTMVAIERLEQEHGATDIWTADVARGAFSRLTSGPGWESVAAWSPDGRQVAFASDEKSTPRVKLRNASGIGEESVLVDGRSFVTDWSRDGRILYVTDGGSTRLDVWTYDVATHTGAPLLNSRFNESLAKYSPDGKWIVYVSDEGLAPQVYVRSMSDAGVKVQVSTGGGNQPQWRRDGKELFYLAPDSMLMAADVRADGARISVSAPQPLFATHVDQPQVLRNHYVASNDGERFLVMAPVGDPQASRLVAVFNWTAGLAGK